jgi:hypothetical protein
MNQKDSLTFFVSTEAPTSVDPLLYDFFKHHPIQSMVNCTLTTLHRGTGVVSPELAISWSEEDGGTIWKFKLRSDVKFFDGKLVTSNDVVASIRRIIYLFRNQSSNYSFVNRLIGIENFKSLDSELPGVSSEEDQVVFRFSEPIINFPEVLSFGHFAIVSKEDFDAKTGKWIHQNSLAGNGCGTYRILSAHSTRLILEKRDDQPSGLSNKTGFKNITQVFEFDYESPPLISIGRENSKAFNTNYRFFSDGGRTILYLRVFPWNKKESYWAHSENRIAVREAIYKALTNANFGWSRSFFPLVINGISEPKFNDPTSSQAGPRIKVSINDPRLPNGNVETHKLVDTIFSGIISSGIDLNPRLGISTDVLFKNKNSSLKEYDLDLGLFSTGISLENPMGDVRLMFSKEGIWLPDPSRAIANELGKDNFNLQFINQKINDDAVVWPIAVISAGFWAHESLDMSDYNVLKPLGELQWIGRKK